MKKVHVNVQIHMLIYQDEDVDITSVLENMDYNFKSNSDKGDIIDTEIVDWEVTDSR